MYSSLLKQIESDLKKEARPIKNLSSDYVELPKTYLQLRAATLHNYKLNKISSLSTQDQWKLYVYFIKHTSVHEVITWVLYQIKKLDTSELIDYLPQLIIIQEKHIYHWSHADLLASFFARILESHPSFIKQLEQWNTSKNFWNRRQSVVGLFYYASARTSYPTFTSSTKLIIPLLLDSEYYVQKGVGWTLRELYNVYPQQTYKFLCSHIHNISSHAFTAATEKLESNDKKKLKILRSSKVVK